MCLLHCLKLSLRGNHLKDGLMAKDDVRDAKRQLGEEGEEGEGPYERKDVSYFQYYSLLR